MGDIEFLFRGNGKIIIGNGVKLDSNIRLLSANDLTLVIKANTNIGKSTVINAGADISVGENVLTVITFKAHHIQLKEIT